MDFEQMKKDIKEIAAIAEGVPEAFRDHTYEVLLTEYLKGLAPPRGNALSPPPPDAEASGASEELPGTADQEDIVMADLHAKTKKFLGENDLSLAHVNELFYKEGEEILPLYEDLGTTQLSESQLRIALLQAFRNALGTGDYVFNVEQVRTEAQERKAYDSANFSSNLKAHAKNFDGFSKYDKKKPDVRLSVEGKKRLAALVKQITSA